MKMWQIIVIIVRKLHINYFEMSLFFLLHIIYNIFKTCVEDAWKINWENDSSFIHRMFVFN